MLTGLGGLFATKARTMRKPSESFVTDVMPYDLLDTVIDWIKENLNPDDVFDADIIDSWCGENSTPDDVFSDGALGRWAENNGYVLEDME